MVVLYRYLPLHSYGRPRETRSHLFVSLVPVQYFSSFNPDRPHTRWLLAAGLEVYLIDGVAPPPPEDSDGDIELCDYSNVYWSGVSPRPEVTQAAGA